MLFLAHINDKGDTEVATKYDDDNNPTLSRIFCTVAVTQYQIDPVRIKREGLSEKENEKHPLYAMDQASSVQGQGSYHFDLPLNIAVLDALTIGFQTGALKRGTIIDLREDNWDNIKNDYEQKKGYFAYMKKQEHTIS